MFSKSCEYAIKVVLYLSTQITEETPLQLEEIAKAIDSPESYTAKILQKLSKHHILSSVKGYKGGYLITPQTAKRLTLAHIVELYDGEKIFKNCGLGLKYCSAANPCALHDDFVRMRENLRKTLSSQNLEQLGKDVIKKNYKLKR